METETITEAAELFEGLLNDDGGLLTGDKENANEEILSGEESHEEEYEEEYEEEAEEEVLTAGEEEAEEVPEADEEGQWITAVQESLQDNPELLEKLQLKLNVAGEDQEITLADLKKSRMLEGDYTRKTQALAEQRKALGALQEEAKTKIAEQINNFSAMTQALEGQLLEEFNSVNWKELEQYDPAEWSLKRQKFQEKYGQINQIKAHAQQKAFEFQHKTIAEQREAGLTHLLGQIPEWKDDSVRAKEFTSIRNSLLQDYGMDEKFVDSVVEPGLILLARDAMAYRQGKTAVAEKGKKLKKLPKFTKPGAKQTKASTKSRHRKNKSKLAQTGKLKDAARVFYDME